MRGEYTTIEIDFHAKSSGCSGFGHEASTCSLDEEEVGEEAGEEVEKEVGGRKLGKYITDSAATCNMTPDADGFTNHRECSRPVGLANGGLTLTSITGYGELTVAFRSDNGWVHIKEQDVATVDVQPHIASVFGTQRPHVCRRQKWGNSQAEEGEDRTFSPDWKVLPLVQRPPRGEG